MPDYATLRANMVATQIFANGVTEARLSDRKDLLDAFDDTRRDLDTSGTMAGLDAYTGKALEMVTGGKVRTADFGVPFTKGSGIAGWLDSLPKILAGDSFRFAMEALIRARAATKSRSGHLPSPTVPARSRSVSARRSRWSPTCCLPASPCGC